MGSSSLFKLKMVRVLCRLIKTRCISWRGFERKNEKHFCSAKIVKLNWKLERIPSLLCSLSNGWKDFYRPAQDNARNNVNDFHFHTFSYIFTRFPIFPKRSWYLWGALQNFQFKKMFCAAVLICSSRDLRWTG